MKLQLDCFTVTFHNSFRFCRNQSLLRLMTTERPNQQDDIFGLLEVISSRLFERKIKPACGRWRSQSPEHKVLERRNSI